MATLASDDSPSHERHSRSYYLLEYTAAEAARQELQHQIFYDALGNHHLAAMPACPFPAGARILDVGCGDGSSSRVFRSRTARFTSCISGC